MDHNQTGYRHPGHLILSEGHVGFSDLMWRPIGVMLRNKKGGKHETHNQKDALLRSGCCHGAVLHEGKALGRITYRQNALFGEVLLDDVLKPDLTTHGIAIGTTMAVNDDGVKFFDAG